MQVSDNDLNKNFEVGINVKRRNENKKREMKLKDKKEEEEKGKKNNRLFSVDLKCPKTEFRPLQRKNCIERVLSL